MLLRFRVTNYKSILDEIDLNLTPSKKIRRLPHHIYRTKNSNLNALKGSVIYGANAAGKSNICGAMEVGKDLICLERTVENVNISQFDSERESTFEYEIQVDGITYAFGFSILNRKIAEEWLYIIEKDDAETLIFKYENADINSLSLMDGLAENIGTEESLYVKFLFRAKEKTSLFLTEIVKKLEIKHRFVDCASIVKNWFEFNFEVINPDSTYIKFEDDVIHNEECKRFYTTFLKAFDTGIEDIEMASYILSDLPKETQNRIEDLISNENEDGEWGFVITDESSRFNVSVINGSEITSIEEVCFRCNKDNKKLFKMNELSDGTKRLTDLIPALYAAIYRNRTLVIDEMDRSLHPLIVKIMLEFFYSKDVDTNGQLIITTHDSSLMEQAYLRADEIWFTQKEHDGSTILYSLAEYDIRTDKSLVKDYFDGRFGGVINYRKAQDVIKELFHAKS